MNNLTKFFLCIFSSILLLLLTISLVEIRTNIALNDYSMFPSGVKVVDKAILGRRERTLANGLMSAYYDELQDGILRAFRRNAIELVCTNQGNVLLSLKILNYRGIIINDKPILQIDDDSLRGGKVPIKNITYLGNRYFHTIVSDPLSKREKTLIIRALEQSNFTTISFYAMDGSNLFTNDAKVSEVKQLINNCQP